MTLQIVARCEAPDCTCGTTIIKNDDELYLISAVLEYPEPIRYVTADGFVNGKWSTFDNVYQAIVDQGTKVRAAIFK